MLRPSLNFYTKYDVSGGISFDFFTILWYDKNKKVKPWLHNGRQKSFM